MSTTFGFLYFAGYYKTWFVVNKAKVYDLVMMCDEHV